MRRLGFVVLCLGACVASDSESDPISGEGKADGETCPNDPQSVVTLATGQVWPGSIAVDDSRVDWRAAGSGTGDGSVWTTSRCAGGTPQRIASGQSVPSDLALDASSVYWVTYDAGSSQGTVMKRAKSGGTPVSLATGENGPIALALRAGDVYYLTLDALKRVRSDGSSAPKLLSSISCGHGGLAIDATHVYWTEDCVMFGTPRIARWGSSGSQTVLRGDATPQNFAADATHLYWTRWTRDGLLIERVKKECGWFCSAETIAMADGYSGPVAVDATHVYFTANPDNSIYAVAKSGGTPVVIAASPNNVSSLAIAGDRVYWTVQGTAGAVYKAPLP